MGLLPFSITPSDMNWTQRKTSDPCPQSAVGHGVGLAGLGGLLLWPAVARHFGMDAPYAGMAGVFACGVPMVLLSLLVDKVHLRASPRAEERRVGEGWGIRGRI